MKLKHIGLAVGAGLFLVFNLRVMAQGFTTQHSFTNTPEGASPRQVAWANGYFYGSTFSGGTNGTGSIYKFNPNGPVFTTVYSFTASTENGKNPNNLLAANNQIYGTTYSGGTNSRGMIYVVNTSGAGFTPMHSFGGSPDGDTPTAGLILGGNTLYGTTYSGGTIGFGTVFCVNTNGTGYAILHSFTNTPDGNSPQSELVLGGSTLYGTTAYGGTNGAGMVYSMSTNGGNFTILRSFTNFPDGKYPYGGLVLNSGILYGTTGGGGSNNTGTIFAINTNGGGYKILHHFAGYAGNIEGTLPKATMTFSGGYLYGTASGGGSGGGILGGGTLFQINTNGAGFAVIRSFTNNAATGSDLESGVIRVDSTLWGTAYQGGIGGNGILYSELLSPLITSQPQNLTVTNGNPATFTVTATDDGTTNYQWYFNTNTLLAGKTSSTLNLVGTTTNNAGAYTVTVSDNFGTVTSSPALLTVVAFPAILQQPSDLTVTNGFPASFTNVAAGTGPLFYQWYFNTNTPVNGGTSAILPLNPATTNDAGYYSVIVTNLYGSATSSAARLTVIVPPTAPTITQPPQNYTVTNGYDASFTNVASGTAPLSYQWYFNTNTLVAGGTNNILLVPFAATNQAGYYTVVVSNLAGNATSAPARLTVVSTKPIIFVPPQNLIVTNGDTANFSVTAAGQSPLRYQWYSNSVSTAIGTLLPLKTNSTYSFTSITNSNGRYYSVVITNTLGRATSSPALLTVVSSPLITSNPQPASVHLGDPATFSVTALGLNLRYQWYSNSVSTAIGTLLAGQTNSTYSFTSITNSNGRYYSVVITNTFGRATSSPPALLTVSSLPYITLPPLGVTLTNGGFLSFTSTAAGPGPLAYQWLFQTNSFIAGATNPVLVITNANQPGMYAMKVTNTFGAVTSTPAQLVVIGQPMTVSAKFAAASGSYAFSYVNLAGSTNRLWITTNLSAANFWRALATNVMATNGLWFFTDTNSARSNNIRFYRFSTP